MHIGKCTARQPWCAVICLLEGEAEVRTIATNRDFLDFQKRDRKSQLNLSFMRTHYSRLDRRLACLEKMKSRM